jgi:hypothetical protein
MNRNNGGVVGVILVVILLAILVQVKPDYFKFLFKSFLGNLILVGLVLIISIMDMKWGVGLAAITIIIYQAFYISCKEGFSAAKKKGNKPVTGVTTKGSSWGVFPEGYPIPKTSVWPKKLIDDFVKFQKVHNPNLRFDLDIIQQQANAGEAETLLKTGKWPWTPDVMTLYKNAVSQNNIINNEPGASLSNVQSIYNQMAILELLSWNTKEGNFLLNGATVTHTYGMPADVNNVVRCGKNNETGKISMQKIVYTGYNGVNGSLVSQVTPISNSDIPKEVNGFKFLKSECNPCSAIDDPADYSCPFSLNVGDGPEISDVWQQLWGLNTSGSLNHGVKKTDALSPDTVSPMNDFNKDNFPILTQLKDELMKGASYLNVSFKKPETYSSHVSKNIGAITGSSVPAIVTNAGDDKKIYYGTKNTF